MKKMAGFAAAVFLGLMLTSCQGTQKAEQSGYKVFCRNAEATALREVQYEPEAEGGEKLVEELAKKGHIYQTMQLVNEYYQICGQEEALRNLAIATNNFEI